ncbi:MAG: PAS domain S-box protein [Pirellulaceae bacterium]|nr:PAS domain S-box protein [Pirellulaceae bacterium]
MDLLEQIDEFPFSGELRLNVTEMTHQRFYARERELAASTDRLFRWVMLAQFAAALIAALVFTPMTWIGGTGTVHLHVWAALLIGGTLAGLVWYLSTTAPGRASNAYVIAIAQVMMSVLLIHLTGGRIETHFHIFGSLAFLARYRNIRVVLLATALVILDHGLRSFLWPQSIFGLTQVQAWRWLEHTGWIVFEDIVLIAAITQSRKEMWRAADQWVQLSLNKQGVENEVHRKTHELEHGRHLLQASQSRLQTIIDTAYDAYLSLDRQLNIVDWSRRAEQLTGWNAGQVVGKSCAELLALNELIDAIKKALEFRAHFRDGDSPCATSLIETLCQTSGGKPFYVEASWNLIGSQEQFCIHIFLRDIMDRKQQAMQQLHSQKMESIGQLAAGIAHEINSPSQFVGDNLCFLEKAFQQIESLMGWMNETLDPSNSRRVTSQEKVRMKLDSTSFKRITGEIPKAIQQSREGMHRISSITRAMKEFSHPGTGQMVSIDLHESIQQTLTVCRNEWKYVAEVVTEFSDEVSKVQCHPVELNQVIINLVVNAAHAIGEIVHQLPAGRGRIVVRTRLVRSTHSSPSELASQATQLDQPWEAGHEMVEIEIEDNGPGIPESIRSRIYDPFFTTKPVGKGTGQGLAIAHKVMERHHGSIHLNSIIGQGTTFQLRLPVAQAASPSQTLVNVFDDDLIGGR